MIQNRVSLDTDGIDKLLHSKEVKAGLRVIAEDLKDAAAKELRSHVKHDGGWGSQPSRSQPSLGG